jgi:hypothetical protein
VEHDHPTDARNHIRREFVPGSLGSRRTLANGMNSIGNAPWNGGKKGDRTRTPVPVEHLQLRLCRYSVDQRPREGGARTLDQNTTACDYE